MNKMNKIFSLIGEEVSFLFIFSINKIKFEKSSFYLSFYFDFFTKTTLNKPKILK